MALPVLIAGIAIGGLAVVAFNNKAKIAKEVKSGIDKAKEFAKEGLEKTREFQRGVEKEVKSRKRGKSTKRAARKPRATKVEKDGTEA